MFHYSLLHITIKSVVGINQSPPVYVLKVKNEFRELNLTVFIRVPVKLGVENIWTNKNLQVKVCANQINQGETNTNQSQFLSSWCHYCSPYNFCSPNLI